MAVDTKTILYMLARNFDLKRDTIKERLRLQKTIYLLQAHGLQLGYGFSWYRYGPYSQDLVYDAYAVLGSERQKHENAARGLSFSRNTLRKFEKFRQICGDVLNDAGELEVAASVDFVRQTWPEKGSIEDLDKFFKEHKKQLFDRRMITTKMIEKALGVSQKLRGN